MSNETAIGWTDATAEEAEELDRQREEATAPDPRLEMMRTDGINGEMISTFVEDNPEDWSDLPKDVSAAP